MAQDSVAGKGLQAGRPRPFSTHSAQLDILIEVTASDLPGHKVTKTAEK
jgi:hypothetical protein